METALFQEQEAWEEAAEVCAQIGRSNWDWMKRNLLKLFRTRMVPCPGHWGLLFLSCLQTNAWFHCLWPGKWACKDLVTYFCSLWKSTAQTWLYYLHVPLFFMLPLGQVPRACSLGHLTGSRSHSSANCFLTCRENVRLCPRSSCGGDSHRHRKGSVTRAAPDAFAGTQSAMCPSGITANLQSPWSTGVWSYTFPYKSLIIRQKKHLSIILSLRTVK